MESFPSPGSRASLSFETDLTEFLRFFFQPVDLVFELADLSVKFRFSLLQGLRFVILFPGEDLGKILEEGLLPLGYLVWMNAVFRTYLRQCTLFPKSFENYLGLECRIVSLSHGCICSLPEFVPPGLSYHLRPWSSFRGVAPYPVLCFLAEPGEERPLQKWGYIFPKNRLRQPADDKKMTEAAFQSQEDR